MADKNAEVAVEDNGGMKKTLSLWNFFTIGFGAIIGTGWVLQVGDWMVVGGGPVPAMIAFLLGAIFLVPVGAVFGELTAAIPISGGIVEYVDRSFGRTLSYITGWLLALGNGILCPWEAIAISTLVSEMLGSLPGLEWLRAVKLYTILGAADVGQANGKLIFTGIWSGTEHLSCTNLAGSIVCLHYQIR